MKNFILFFFVLLVFSSDAQVKLDVEGDMNIEGRINMLSAGTNNLFIGWGSGVGITTGGQNTFTGVRAGYLATIGGSNTYFGYEAGRNGTSGSENCAFGRFALSNNQLKSKNIAIGSRALLNLQYGYGHDPLSGTSDIGTTYNLAIGTSAGQLTNDPSGSGAARNTFIGNNSGLYNNIGYRNTFLGFQSGDNNRSGSYNTCVGGEADLSDITFTNSGSFGDAAIVNASNKIRIGDGGVSTVEGNGWSLPSDARFKNNVQENVPGLDFLMELRPVTYQFDMVKYTSHISPNEDAKRSLKHSNSDIKIKRLKEVSAMTQTGFIAQEVEEIAYRIGYDFNGIIRPTNDKDNYGICYNLFVVPLVRGIQEQQAQIETIKSENKSLRNNIASQAERIKKLEFQVEQLISMVE
jgi:hypothetical protein